MKIYNRQNDTYQLPVIGSHDHPICYARKGTRQLGRIPVERCGKILTSCKRSNVIRLNCKYNCSLLQANPLVPPGECPRDLNCTCTYNVQAPGADRTVTQTPGWWRCGHRVYDRLPRDWTGICAPVRLTDHTIIIHHNQMQNQKRRDPTTVVQGT